MAFFSLKTPVIESATAKDGITLTGTSTIGNTDDTDLLTFGNGVLTVAGEISVTILDIGGINVEASAAELNIIHGVTSTTEELNLLDGVTSTTAELNILHGVTATAAELNILDGVTATEAELNYNATGAGVGTVVASKTVTVDANKDVGTIRNLTIDGVFTDGNYTFDTSGNVSGLGTVACGAITSSAASTFNAGIIVKNGDANDGGFIQFFEDSDNGSYSVKLALPMDTNLSDDITVRLPTSTGLLLTSGANEYTDTQTFSSKIILTPQIETISDTTATGVSLTITKTVVLLTVTDNDGTEDITISVAAGTSGQLVHIFFTGEGGTDESRNVRLNFGSNSLISGSGRNQYLTFTVTGQSASLIYINDTSGNNIDGWRIINTGAAVSSS
jgi:hypothetical protein